jgi:hypothetical protein
VVAEAVAATLGVDEVFAEILPEDKDQAVAELPPSTRPSTTSPQPLPQARNVPLQQLPEALALTLGQVAKESASPGSG